MRKPDCAHQDAYVMQRIKKNVHVIVFLFRETKMILFRTICKIAGKTLAVSLQQKKITDNDFWFY